MNDEGVMYDEWVMLTVTSPSSLWGEELLEVACSSLAEEMTLDPSAPGGMVTYRRTLTLSLFYKFYLTVLQKLAAEVRPLIPYGSPTVVLLYPYCNLQYPTVVLLYPSYPTVVLL